MSSDESVDSDEDFVSSIAQPDFEDPECDPYRLDINFQF